MSIGGKELLEPQPELTRREDDIGQVEVQEHPLLLIAKNCLRDKDENRPAAREICVMVAGLKKKEDYTDSPNIDEEIARLEAEVDQLMSNIGDRVVEENRVVIDKPGSYELIEGYHDITMDQVSATFYPSRLPPHIIHIPRQRSYYSHIGILTGTLSCVLPV